MKLEKYIKNLNEIFKKNDKLQVRIIKGEVKIIFIIKKIKNQLYVSEIETYNGEQKFFGYDVRNVSELGKEIQYIIEQIRKYKKIKKVSQKLFFATFYF